MARKPALVRQISLSSPPATYSRPPEAIESRTAALFLSGEEMAAIAAATIADRNQLLVRSLVETGARVGELLKLTAARLGQGCGTADRKAVPVRGQAVYLGPARRSDAIRHRTRAWPRRSLLADHPPARSHTCHRSRFISAKRERRDGGVLLEGAYAGLAALFRHGAATAILEDSDYDAVFVRDQLGTATRARRCTTLCPTMAPEGCQGSDCTCDVEVTA